MIPCEYRHKWYIAKKLDSLSYISLAGCFGVSSTIFTQWAPSKATKFNEIMQTTWPIRRSRSFKVTDFGTNRRLVYDFLLMINTNFPPILHRFQVMADYWSNFRYRHGSASIKCPRWGWSPENIQIYFTSPETRWIVLPDAKNRTIVCSFFWTKHRIVTDGRTDRQTSSSYYSDLHCEQCGRAVKSK